MSIIAFGAGVFVSAIALFVTSLFKQGGDLFYYISSGAFWFALGYSVTLLVSRVPNGYLAWLEFLDRAAYLKVETAKRYKQLDDINSPPILEGGPRPKVVYDRSAKWQDWFISVFEWAGDSIKYDKHLDAVMTYDLWRKVLCKSLMDHQPPLIEPVQGGNRTEFRGGLTGPAILALLKSGMLVLPYPTEHDPPPRLPAKANAETRQKGDETPKTQYAKDVD